jgi:hypothetical protein
MLGNASITSNMIDIDSLKNRLSSETFDVRANEILFTPISGSDFGIKTNTHETYTELFIGDTINRQYVYIDSGGVIHQPDYVTTVRGS